MPSSCRPSRTGENLRVPFTLLSFLFLPLLKGKKHTHTHTLNASKKENQNLPSKVIFPAFIFFFFGLSDRIFYIPVKVPLLIYEILSFYILRLCL